MKYKEKLMEINQKIDEKREIKRFLKHTVLFLILWEEWIRGDSCLYY